MTEQPTTTYARIVANLRRSEWPVTVQDDGETKYVGAELGPQTAVVDSGIVAAQVIDDADQPTGRFKMLIDLDVDAVLIPSSHNGRHHLLIDHEVTKEQHDRVLSVLAEVGAVEPGYAKASSDRNEGARLRTPWKLKDDGAVSAERRTWGDEFRDALVFMALRAADLLRAGELRAAGGDR
ncbi:hypothetical protein SEA_BOCK_60 [Gordonia phage Bock]|nr:hypothetical protein SEA_BOCK_60 [Gordonia phage Bock]